MEKTNSFKHKNPDTKNGTHSWRQHGMFALLFIVSAVFLFSNLGAKYLWQDEAVTAELGIRLMKFGKPLAYDGINLITMDYIAGESSETIDQHKGDPDITVQYYADQGDYKQDTAWIGQPWGQFLVTGLSLKLLGHSTVGARLPFSIAALLTIVLFYWFVRRQFKDPVLGLLATVILLTNVFWIIHSRQCRYYALSSLFLLLTLITFVRWQRGRPWGGAIFIITAWCWFQIDFGSFFPMAGILLLMSVWTDWLHIKRALSVGLALGIAIMPWVWYYELGNRVKPSAAPWIDKFLLNFFHFNQFLIPLLILLAASILLVMRWRTLDLVARQILFASMASLFAALAWVPTVAPYAFYRYIVNLTPLAALCTAWLLNEITKWIIRHWSSQKWRYLILGLLVFFAVICPFFSNLIAVKLRPIIPNAFPIGRIIRPEWSVLYEEVFNPRPDPNRLTVEALEQVASPNDEILTNYEDAPLMFYTNHRIRGGIHCFRADISSQTPPRFIVYRRSVPFVHKNIFQRIIMRYHWKQIRSDIPDVPWGNIPEPELRLGADPCTAPRVFFAENLGVLRQKKIDNLDIVAGKSKNRQY